MLYKGNVGIMETIINDKAIYARYLLSKSRYFMTKVRKKELAPYQISAREVFIIDIMMTLNNKTTLAELAKHANRGIGTISVQLTKMEHDGFIKRVRDNPKSTLLKFELTEKGLEIYNTCKKLKGLKTIMSVLSEEELELFINMLEKITKKAEKMSNKS
jgi:DNA-binding MarR family transcriptional regulator